MRRLRIWRHRLRSIFAKDQADEHLSRELAFHMEQLAAENMAAGMTAQEAREAARRSFGNIPLLAEECRDRRRVGWLLDLWQDLAYASRLLRRNLRFTAVAVASLALGIGANTVILGTLRASVAGAIPLPAADRLVTLRAYRLQDPGQSANATVPEFLAWQQRLRSYSAIGVSIVNRQDLTDAGNGLPPERLIGQGVTPGLFRALDVQPVLGRTFTEEEGDLEAPARVIVLGYGLWQRLFGGSADVLHRRLEMNGTRYTVIGVMPQGFWYPQEDCEYWVPIGFVPAQRQASARFFAVTARLKDGVSRQQAQAELDAVSAEFAREFPERQGDWRARIVTLHDLWFGWLRMPLSALGAAGGMVLLIACTNVGALLLARASARQPEFAMRIALGAGRSRLVRQLLAEGLLLAAFAGVGSAAVAWACVRVLALVQPPPAGIHAGHLTLGASAVAIGSAISLLSGIAAWAAPVLWGLRHGTPLRQSAEPRSSARWRNALVTIQLSLSLMLLIASGHQMKSLARMVSLDQGFDIHGLLSFEFHLPPQLFLRPAGSYEGLPVAEARATDVPLERVFSRLRAIPGVQSVGGLTAGAMNGLVVPAMTVLVDGRPRPANPAERAALSAVHLHMTPGYLRTVRAVLVRGRDIDEADTAGAPWVAVINEAMARKFWPGEDPIGRRFTFDVAAGERPRTVIGVVQDMAQLYGNPARPTAYTSYRQQPEAYRGPYANQYGEMTFVVRSAGDAMDLVPAVRRAIAEVEPQRTISNIQRLAWWDGFGTVNRGLYAGTIAAFALVATALACIGVYGVTAYALSRRTREMGIRLALGARVRDIRVLLCRDAVHLIAAGVALGGAGALALTRLVDLALQDAAAPADPAVFAGAIALLTLVAFASSFAPARAVRGIDPAAVLRSE